MNNHPTFTEADRLAKKRRSDRLAKKWLSDRLRLLEGATIECASVEHGAPALTLLWTAGPLAGERLTLYCQQDEEGNGPGYLEGLELLNPSAPDALSDMAREDNALRRGNS